MSITSPPPGSAAHDARRVAGGSGLVLLGGLFDRGIRWAIKWYLAHALGPAGLGAYSFATRVAQTVTSFSPLGLDTGIIYFAARFLREGERDRLKGVFLTGLFASMVGGVVGALGLYLYVHLGVEPGPLADTAALVAPVVVPWTVLLFFVGALKARKDQRRSTLAYQITLPLAMALLTGVFVGVFDWGVRGALLGMGLAMVIALAQGALMVFRSYRELFREPMTQPRWEIGALLRYSGPQALTAAAFQLNLQLDGLMLAQLGGVHKAGLYEVAASLASFGAVPANAVATVLNPFIAELAHTGERERLNRLLQVITRWLILVSVPAYLVLLLLPDLILHLYSDVYAVSAMPLVILAAGQSINTVCSPAMRLIPMSGHAMLNLGNAVVAVVLNVALNSLLIPLWGPVGAAAASALTLSAWSIWRLAEVWHLLRCFPFDRESLLLIVVSLGGALSIRLGIDGLAARVAATALLIGGFLVLGVLRAQSPEDAAIKAAFLRKLRRKGAA